MLICTKQGDAGECRGLFFYLVCTTINKGGEARVGGPLTTHSLDLEALLAKKNKAQEVCE